MVISIDDCRVILPGTPVSFVWRGHGSAIFLEFGRLRPIMRSVTSWRPVAEPGRPQGEIGLMVGFDWHHERGKDALYRSADNDEICEPRIKNMVSRKVVEVSTTGEPPGSLLRLEDDPCLVRYGMPGENRNARSPTTAAGFPDRRQAPDRASRPPDRA